MFVRICSVSERLKDESIYDVFQLLLNNNINQ
jgi:hypothetical protein